MTPDDDPLWYDRTEPDEPDGFVAQILIAVLVAVELVIMLTTALFRTLRRGVFLAFHDVKP